MRCHDLIVPLIAVAGRIAIVCSPVSALPPKRPLPTVAELQAAERRLPDAAEIQGKAKNAADAKTYFRLALDRDDDPTSQCALLIRARNLAEAAGDVELTIQSIDALGDRFEFDALSAKAASLENLAKALRAKSARRQLFDTSCRLAEDALVAERFELAERIAKAASVAANYDHRLRGKARLLSGAVDYASKHAENRPEAVAAARERLRAAPEVLPALMTMGLHAGFSEHDWEAAQEHFEKAGETLLAKAAGGEVESPKSAQERLALADAWWDLALDPGRADDRDRFVLRAVHWYRLAITALDGQAKAKSSDRLSQWTTVLLAGSRLAGRRTNEAVEFQLADNVVLRLVKIPGGMTDNTAVEPFYLSETETTQEQWLTLMPDNPSSQTGDALLPVNDLTHQEAEEFVKALNHSGAAEGFRFRLPTPAEWLHACLGNLPAREQVMRELLDRQAWRQTNSAGRLHPVARLERSGLGLFDMLGNCAEWTSDPNLAFGFSYANRINASKLRKAPLTVPTAEGHHARTIGFRVAAERRVDLRGR